MKRDSSEIRRDLWKITREVPRMKLDIPQIKRDMLRMKRYIPQMKLFSRRSGHRKQEITSIITEGYSHGAIPKQGI